MMKRPFKTWVLSGPSASGKGEVAAFLVRHGFARIDVDRLAHGLYRRGSVTYKRVLAAFGPGLAGLRGIKRKALGRLVFAQPRRLKILDKIVLPVLKREISRKLAALKRQGRRAAVIDMAVYFKAGAPAWGPLILVEAPLALRLRRLRQRGLSLDRASRQARALQFGPRERRRASIRILNSGSLASLKVKLKTLWLKGALR